MSPSSVGSRTRTIKTATRAPETEGRRTSAPTAKLPTASRMPPQAASPTTPRARMPSTPPPAKLAQGGSYSVVKKSPRAQTSDIEAVSRRVKVAMLGQGVHVEIGDLELSLSRREASSLIEQLYAALK